MRLAARNLKENTVTGENVARRKPTITSEDLYAENLFYFYTKSFLMNTVSTPSFFMPTG